MRARMGHSGRQGDGPKQGKHQDVSAFSGLSRWAGNMPLTGSEKPERKAGFRGRNQFTDLKARTTLCGHTYFLSPPLLRQGPCLLSVPRNRHSKWCLITAEMNEYVNDLSSRCLCLGGNARVWKEALTNEGTFSSIIPHHHHQGIDGAATSSESAGPGWVHQPATWKPVALCGRRQRAAFGPENSSIHGLGGCGSGGSLLGTRRGSPPPSGQRGKRGDSRGRARGLVPWGTF